jgi:hypothetical protein
LLFGKGELVVEKNGDDDEEEAYNDLKAELFCQNGLKTDVFLNNISQC